MSPLRLNGSTSGYAELAASAAAGDVILTLPSTAGTLDRTNRSGNILQVVSATYTTMTSSSSTTFADTGLTASITPASSSNKVLVLVTQNGCWKSNGNSGSAVNLRLVTPVINQIFGSEIGFTGTALELLIGSCSFVYLDSPASTSSCTYKTQFSQRVNAASIQVQTNSAVSSITLLEVAA